MENRKLYYKNGALQYEGEVEWFENPCCYAPCGKGIKYFLNGNIWQKGIFSYWWLVDGEEYLFDGTLLYIGKYNDRCDESISYYGPSYFTEGTLYHDDGTVKYKGVFIKKSIGSLGWPQNYLPNDEQPIRRDYEKVDSGQEEGINIYSKGTYPANVLSNFYENAFEIDCIKCASMEGFLQSLKYRSSQKQQNICLKSGVEAKNAGKHKWLWKLTGMVYWQKIKIVRQSAEYQVLIERAYDELCKNANFAKALMSTENSKLTHSIGKKDPKKTILTEKEFINNLTRLREKTLIKQ